MLDLLDLGDLGYAVFHTQLTNNSNVLDMLSFRIPN
jgi:hypothetical protein